MLCFNGCNSEELKSLVIRVSSSLPVEYCGSNPYLSGNMLSLEYQEVALIFKGNIPEHIGQNSIEYVGSALPNTTLNFLVIRQDYGSMWDSATSTYYLDNPICCEVLVEIEFDGEIVYSNQRNIGGYPTDLQVGWHDGQCGYGSEWSVNCLLP